MPDIWESAVSRMDFSLFVSETILRLLVAAILGGIIGLERELARKPAGLRTNMFICFGAAMFTTLSFRFAGPESDPARIAAQIIPGIGFIGAGSILHSRGAVTGITTAATMFVVASIGMAVGGGEYLSAIFATLVILVSLHFLGWLETRLNFKRLVMSYHVAAANPEALFTELNRVLHEEKQVMRTVELAQAGGKHRAQFSVDATMSQHQALIQKLRRSDLLERVDTLQGETE